LPPAQEESDEGPDTDVSVFGFGRLYVDDVGRFNEGVREMVMHDVHRCWHTNGRPIINKPTGIVYELFRQLGIHPVRASRDGVARAGRGGSRDFASNGKTADGQGLEFVGYPPPNVWQGATDAPSFSSDILPASEYVFSYERMRNNCHRLRIGAIRSRKQVD